MRDDAPAGRGQVPSSALVARLRAGVAVPTWHQRRRIELDLGVIGELIEVGAHDAAREMIDAHQRALPAYVTELERLLREAAVEREAEEILASLAGDSAAGSGESALPPGAPPPSPLPPSPLPSSPLPSSAPPASARPPSALERSAPRPTGADALPARGPKRLQRALAGAVAAAAAVLALTSPALLEAGGDLVGALLEIDAVDRSADDDAAAAAGAAARGRLERLQGAAPPVHETAPDGRTVPGPSIGWSDEPVASPQPGPRPEDAGRWAVDAELPVDELDAREGLDGLSGELAERLDRTLDTVPGEALPALPSAPAVPGARAAGPSAATAAEGPDLEVLGR
jgi:hypothetical protein